MAIKMEMLRCLVAVADTGGLAGAGARLNRTPSAVSMMLKQLEDHLGRPLFATDRKRDLSPLGLFVLEQARQELQQFDRRVDHMEQYARTGIGVVRVVAVPSVAGTLLPSAFHTFLAANPDVRVTLGDMDSSAVLQTLEQGRADLGIASVGESAWSAGRTPLFEDDFGLVLRPDHPLASSSAPLPWEALHGLRFIGNELCEHIEHDLPRALCAQARLVVKNTGSLLAMVRAGLGVTVLPRTVVSLWPGDALFRPLMQPQVPRRIDLLHRSDSTMSPLTEELIRHVVAAARAGNG